LLENLAAQAAKEQAEKEAVEQEAAHLAAEEEAAQAAAEEAAWAEQEEAATKTKAETLAQKQLRRQPEEAKGETTVSSPATVKAAQPVVPAPKPKRKPPAEIESKWGVPTAPKGASLLDFSAEDPLLEALAEQAAQETLEKEAAQKEAAAAAAARREAGEAEEEDPAPKKVEVKSSAAVLSPPTVQQAEPVVPAPTPNPKRKPPVEIESKWGAPAVPVGFVLEEDGDMPSLGESLPSLADALTAPKQKAPQPQPKKKDKKKWGKVDTNLLGFDADNPNNSVVTAEEQRK